MAKHALSHNWRHTQPGKARANGPPEVMQYEWYVCLTKDPRHGTIERDLGLAEAVHRANATCGREQARPAGVSGQRLQDGHGLVAQGNVVLAITFKALARDHPNCLIEVDLRPAPASHLVT